MPIIVSKDELPSMVYVIEKLKLPYKIFYVNDENSFLHSDVNELFPPIGDPCVYIFVVKGKHTKMIITKEGLLKSYS